MDGRLKNVDQCLTDDIAMFCQTSARLYSLIAKPLFDIAFIGLTLIYKSRKKGSGARTMLPLTMGFAVLLGTAGLLKQISPKFGEMVSEEAKRKGHLRFLHSRIIAHSEEIAFYGGNEVLY
ncbi:unnamed protein product [Gongylonema pulchrum]|uniref:ABC transmembrane type-1 domain-containing protein n=1 Tax=Gongylonema pulchrum TaxID=637853 RepID=A0A3P6RXP7_9BILA|nr:unnamed protein product [Gongylonema pulchrum]